jgi:hypothetical protein
LSTPGRAPSASSAPNAAVLLTDGDTRADWLAAGQALARVLLTGAAEGLAASPLSQVVDDPGSRERLRRGLRLLGHPQAVLRLGYGHGVGAPRREVDDVLYVGASAAPGDPAAARTPTDCARTERATGHRVRR